MTKQQKAKAEFIKRFWSYVDRTENCWNWLGFLNKGYGYIRTDSFYGRRGNSGAHRVAYELIVGPIPKGKQLDHLCRNRSCVNPSHLEPVSSRENVLRGVGFAAKNHKKTHCPYGHVLTGRNNLGYRFCRECSNAWHREHYRKYKKQLLRYHTKKNAS